ncbi:DUF72 domain-containing protein [Alteromonas sediminis]|uniref:DUF72 domain-containing protein n=2 Tax=Alteromonas sediminis TaxID=2259342 RepID=A0A3N5YR44_9ALTE|nr:DUF72 domain-containing protein [Alteromonas sediminis]
MWTHPKWHQNWFGTAKAGLADYAQQCSSVEGNTSFYQTPTQERAQQWASVVPADFRFTLKLPREITHNHKLNSVKDILAAFWHAIVPMQSKLGALMAQLPASFGPEHLPQLRQFIEHYHLPVPLAVEVRHLAFFAKGAEERALNRLLVENKVNRVIMDTRALFATPPQSHLEEEVQQKKPRVPVNVIATGGQPIVRFVGGNTAAINEQKLLPWITKCHQWRQQGKTPFVFIHCPDNADAPALLRRFITLYNSSYPDASLPELSFASEVQASLL